MGNECDEFCTSSRFLACRMVSEKNLPYLRKYGHGVYFPTLTGLGETSHQISKNVSLDTHIQVSQLIFYNDLKNVILIAHSYGGAVISGVAEIIPKRIKRLVFL